MKCKSGNNTQGTEAPWVGVPPLAGYGHPVSIDACIVQDIRMLWDHGIATDACCCGHGTQRPSVIIHHKSALADAVALLKRSGRDWDVQWFELMTITTNKE